MFETVRIRLLPLSIKQYRESRTISYLLRKLVDLDYNRFHNVG